MMAKTYVLAAILSLYASFCFSGTVDEIISSEDQRSIALLNISNALSDGLMVRIQKYVELELRIKTEIVSREIDEVDTIKRCVDKVADEDLARHPMTIAFCSLAGEQEHIQIAKKITVINPERVKCADEEKFARRIERLVMRGAGTMAGLGFDPDPRCVMHSYERVEDLDQMGRNFSPPWLDKFQKAAVEMGLEILPFRAPSN